MLNPLIATLRATLDAIDAAPDAAALGTLYAAIVGYNPFTDAPDGTMDDLDDVRMTLTDYVKELACAAGVHWVDVVGGAA